MFVVQGTHDTMKFNVFFLFRLEPKLIAPVVAYLCHEDSNDNGAVIESAAGWATKVNKIVKLNFAEVFIFYICQFYY